MENSRRNFIKGMAASAVLVSATGPRAFGFTGAAAPKVQVAFFTKLLDKYENEFLAETLAMAGVDGFDVTVRPKGKM